MQLKEDFETIRLVDSERNSIPFLPVSLPKEPCFLVQHSSSEEGPWLNLPRKCFTLIEAKCLALSVAEDNPFDWVRVLEKDKIVLKGEPGYDLSFEKAYKLLYQSKVYRKEIAYDGTDDFRVDMALIHDEKEAIRSLERHRIMFPSAKRRMRVETVTVYSDELLPLQR